MLLAKAERMWECQGRRQRPHAMHDVRAANSRKDVSGIPAGRRGGYRNVRVPGRRDFLCTTRRRCATSAVSGSCSAAGADVNAKDDNGSMPLPRRPFSTAQGPSEKLSSPAEAEVNAGASGYTPLHAAADRRHKDVAQLLRKHGRPRINSGVAAGGRGSYLMPLILSLILYFA